MFESFKKVITSVYRLSGNTILVTRIHVVLCGIWYRKICALDSSIYQSDGIQ